MLEEARLKTVLLSMQAQVEDVLQVQGDSFHPGLPY
jgi:hypothetical protein